jgi:hypothetical protein
MAGTRKDWFDYHEEIEALKEERADVWRAALPDHVNDHASDDAAGIERSVRAARLAELDPAVLAIDAQMRAIRAEQMAEHDEPTTAEWEAYYARAAKER